jgi:hypothetical protein
MEEGKYGFVFVGLMCVYVTFILLRRSMDFICGLFYSSSEHWMPFFVREETI